MTEMIRNSLRIGPLLCAPALVAWLSGLPFIFPSLGPTAFSLVTDRRGETTAWKVLGGHLIGVVAGLLAYHLLAHGAAIAGHYPPMSFTLLRLCASAALSLVLTSAGMLAARAQHPPACATTLIVSLGLMKTIEDGAIIMLAVAIMFVVNRCLPGRAR
jgi:HPP family protein